MAPNPTHMPELAIYTFSTPPHHSFWRQINNNNQSKIINIEEYWPIRFSQGLARMNERDHIKGGAAAMLASVFVCWPVSNTLNWQQIPKDKCMLRVYHFKSMESIHPLGFSIPLQINPNHAICLYASINYVNEFDYNLFFIHNFLYS